MNSSNTPVTEIVTVYHEHGVTTYSSMKEYHESIMKNISLTISQVEPIRIIPDTQPVPGTTGNEPNNPQGTTGASE